MKIKIGVIGCLGKMGKAVITELMINKKAELKCAVASSNSEYINLDVGRAVGYSDYGIKITSSIYDLFVISDVVIDFTNRECTLECLKIASKLGKPLLSGTTGIEDINLNHYAACTPILWSANMSIGINVLFKLVEQAAEFLGSEYDVEIFEMHHNTKKDSPSGTAIEFGKIISNTLNKVDSKTNRYLGDNFSNTKQNVGFVVSRGGGVIGDHSVMFLGRDERIELHHKAISRDVFAKGAVRAAMWLYKKPAGLYSMQDII
ncbi:4-hydroxy-tetrahydrodipicolinate reductase [Wolbachia endosymbiont of Pentidionis agamae]|uniref:4-hydroxy-tetrahydrodipicolinate reductase n=1 Tax=Wolbachia endosymbiont of Pentidionis agamae TaxID=3110435 RepID=UPI002FD45284